MTVRWKPLMILSGLFLVVALVGVIAITAAMMPRSSQGILKVARAARDAGRFPDAEIYYKQALQVEPRNATIHEEFAGMYRDWMRQADAEKRAGPPRRAAPAPDPGRQVRQGGPGARGATLLRDAMDQDLAFDSVYWAKELLNVAPDDLDAHYVLAAEGLEERSPNVPEVKRHLDVLEKGKAPAVRRLWIRARLAELAGDDAARAAALAEAQGAAGDGRGPGRRGRPVRPAPADGPGGPLRDPAGRRLAEPVGRLLRAGQGAGQARGPAAGAGRPPADPARADPVVADGPLGQAAARRPEGGHRAGRRHRGGPGAGLPAGAGRRPPARPPDVLSPTPIHLRLRGQPDRCLEVVDRALKSPQASKRTATVSGPGPAQAGRGHDPGQGRGRRPVRQGDAARPGPARQRRPAVAGDRPPGRRLDRPRPLGDRPARWPGPTTARPASRPSPSSAPAR